MPPRTSRAIVQTGPRRLALRDLPLPDVDDDSPLLRVGACGMRGSDVEQHTGTIPVARPLVPGRFADLDAPDAVATLVRDFPGCPSKER